MKLITSLLYSASHPSVVALGCFDGVHLGHAAVLREAKSQAERLGVSCTVWTFDEPPKRYFQPDSAPLITDREEKHRRIAEFGVDTLVSVPFDEALRALCPEEFFQDVLQRRLRASHIVCGYNYSFGARGSGNTDTLRRLCREFGVGLSVVPPVELAGASVSSTAVRQALEQGDARLAATLLGRPYSLCAKVVNGQSLATSLGFPTANQLLPKGRQLPKAGVYATRITVEGENLPRFGISNIGSRPTVSDHTPCCETHLFDFAGDLYGKQITVEFLFFLRPEQKFKNLDVLTEQVRADIQSARQLLRSYMMGETT